MTEESRSGVGRRPRPVVLSNRDYDFFYEGLAERKLLAQQCGGCGTLRNPPGPSCPECHSLDWTPCEMPATGVIYSFTIHRHPPLPDYDTPHPVALVEFDNGLRFVAPVTGIPIEEIRIGMPVNVAFRLVGDMPGLAFAPAFAVSGE